MGKRDTAKYVKPVFKKCVKPVVIPPFRDELKSEKTIVQGVSLPNFLHISGHVLLLNGAGSLITTGAGFIIMSYKLYVAALYVKSLTTDWKGIC